MVALGLVLGVVSSASSATAQDPFYLQSQVTDEAGVLGSEAAVAEAIAKLRTDTGTELWVVYVDTFSGIDSETWVTQTFITSGLGTEDALLAVAVDDRQYKMHVAENSPITQAQLDAAAAAAENKLAADDWAGAAIAAAESLGKGASGMTNSAVGYLTTGIFALIIITIVLRSVLRKRRAGSTEHQAAGALPMKELNRRASAALVAIDDEIKSAEQELGFAQAQFGADATQHFTGTLNDAKAKVTRAFSIRQLLDDESPEPEPQQRAMLEEIITLCAAVSAAIDADTQKFTELRNLQDTVPQALAETSEQLSVMTGRIAPARANLDQLAITYPASTLASIRGNPDQAAQLLDAASLSVSSGKAAVTSGDRGTAVAHSRAAAAALAQAGTLLAAVESAGADLAQAGQRLDTAIASISSDFNDVARLAATDPAVQAAADNARQVINAAQAARSGGDPLAAFQALVTAEAALDAALEPSRGLAEQRSRATAQLQNNLGQLDSILRGTSEFITTRAGAVGPEARTRLSEASRLYNQALTQAQADPVAALATVQQAFPLAQSAQALAQRDVQSWENHQQQNQNDNNLGALILGGLLGRSGGHSYGGGGFSGRSSSRSWSFGGGTSTGRSSGRRSGGRSSGGGFGGGRSSGGGRSGGGRSSGGRF